MYFELYDLINHYIFWDNVDNLANIDLICTLLASLGSIFLIAIPFIIVYKVVSILVG